MITCKRCGASILDNSRFCSYCGTQIIPEAQSPAAGPSAGAAVHFGKYPRMIPVPGGTFIMGQGVPTRRVSLAPFYISETPITQKQYFLVMTKQPSKLIGENRPVESVNWCEALIFCNVLSELHNLKPCYYIGNETNLMTFDTSSAVWKRVSCNFLANGYRLPTEAEWEYAARAGKPTQFAGSDLIDQVAWYGENSSITTHDVAGKAPNALGLYDMCGNVAEWCWDYMEELPMQEMQNPHGPNIGAMHVKRGGSWLDDAEQCTVFFRSASAPTGKSSSLGFRVCRTAQ
ncbi:MAG: SUMF1/EgtB/PvdO family nonheme iron enzyme [Treponema sp.]|nr:SUMF1/EgtB/PvdO family nonheme iron enzyme [Treponema sp.]